MSKFIVITLLTLIMLCATGCGGDVPYMEEPEMNRQSETDVLKIMNVSLEEIEKITLYSDGVEQKISKDSKSFLKIAEIIESNEKLVAMIDGGIILSLHEIGDGNYVKLSTKYECDVYVIDLLEEMQVEYADYESKDNSAISFLSFLNMENSELL